MTMGSSCDGHDDLPLPLTKVGEMETDIHMLKTDIKEFGAKMERRAEAQSAQVAQLETKIERSIDEKSAQIMLQQEKLSSQLAVHLGEQLSENMIRQEKQFSQLAVHLEEQLSKNTIRQEKQFSQFYICSLFGVSLTLYIMYQYLIRLGPGRCDIVGRHLIDRAIQ